MISVAAPVFYNLCRNKKVTVKKRRKNSNANFHLKVTMKQKFWWGSETKRKKFKPNEAK
jgi:hypothetical protein